MRSVMHIFTAVLLILDASAALSQQKVSIMIEKGAVVGRQSTATSFLGIPYASPPVGKLRWSAPQPVSPWAEPRDASRIGNVCPQVVLALFAVPGPKPGDVQGEEDCLYLNVYTPAKARPDSRLPVMVWIHGGAFTVGSGSAFDGSVLAAKYGLVVVTMNYRLGALGFLALAGLNSEGKGERSGNYGLLDQQAALQWVKTNIGAFGGNGQNVTIAGESAGGMSVCAQLASPRAAGLFQRAIIQSGLCESPGNAVTVAEAESRNVEYVRKLGCSATDIDCLRRVEPAKLLSTKVPGRRPVSNLVWSPVYESGVLPLKLKTAFSQGKFNRVPVLAGTNHDEGRLFVSVVSPNGKPVTAVQYWGGTGLLVGAANTRKVLLQYPFRTYGTPALAFATMFTDGVFSCPAERVDNALSKYVPVYAFEFSDPQAATSLKAPADLPGLGSFHSSSQVYAFQSAIPGIAAPSMFSSAQRKLSDEFSGAWAAFVATGDPRAAGAPGWPKFGSSRGDVQEFDLTGVKENTRYSVEHKCLFWSALNLK
jgi:para-nitrobenzyl esterase